MIYPNYSLTILIELCSPSILNINTILWTSNSSSSLSPNSKELYSWSSPYTTKYKVWTRLEKYCSVMQEKAIWIFQFHLSDVSSGHSTAKSCKCKALRSLLSCKVWKNWLCQSHKKHSIYYAQKIHSLIGYEFTIKYKLFNVSMHLAAPFWPISEIGSTRSSKLAWKRQAPWRLSRWTVWKISF